MDDEKKGLVPKLRFPEFREAGEWNSDLVKGLVATVTPPKKLTSDQYEDEGSFPVIDQSQAYICGWTNDEHALVSDELPLIVFGDHTCALKIVDQPFVQGADGIKILKSKNVIEPGFLYQYLLFSPVKMESYKRHFSTLKEKLVIYPEKKTGEQQKIADCLSSLDALIAAQADKIDALKAHKKGLMQQLFPREGETVPRLRFPEFREAGEWVEVTLGKVVNIRSGYSPSRYNLTGEAQYPFLKVEDLNNCDKYQSSSREYSDDELGVVPGSSIIFPKRGAAILNNKVRLNTVEVLMDTNLMAITPKSSVLAEFLYCIVVTEGLSKIADTSTIPQINNKHITPYLIRLPSKPEQQRVADCLSSLDALITAHTEKLEALKTHKKGLMQQLFPSPEAL